tara:strand:+ start:2254 stop:2550 length:297 start_codon:yes stop_codon:yes gene_type:complete
MQQRICGSGFFLLLFWVLPAAVLGFSCGCSGFFLLLFWVLPAAVLIFSFCGCSGFFLLLSFLPAILVSSCFCSGFSGVPPIRKSKIKTKNENQLSTPT